MFPKDFLTRPIKLSLSANGGLVYGHTVPEGFLPVFSVDTPEEAEQMQTMLCRLSREDNETYFLPFTGEVDDLKMVSVLLATIYGLKAQRVDGPALFVPFTMYQAALGLS